MKKQYKEPEEMIDHNGNLDTVSGLMSIFFAYNQKEAEEGTNGPIGQIGNSVLLR